MAEIVSEWGHGRRLPGVMSPRQPFTVLHPTLQFWYDATDFNALAYLATTNLWSDKSGKGRHLNVVENGPPFKENWGGGLAGISDLGNQAGLRTAAFAMPAYSFTCFVTVQRGTGHTMGGGDGNGTKRIYRHANSGGALGNQTIGLHRNNELRVQRPADTTGTNSVKNRTAGAWGSDSGVKRLVRHQHDGTHVGHKLFFNGVEEALGTVGGSGDPGVVATASHPLHLFAGDSLSGYSNQQIGEWLLYSPILTDAGYISAIESYLKAKWSI